MTKPEQMERGTQMDNEDREYQVAFDLQFTVEAANEQEAFEQGAVALIEYLFTRGAQRGDCKVEALEEVLIG